MSKTKDQLKARIRVLENDREDLLRERDAACNALRQIRGICEVIGARAIAGDPDAVGEFAWVIITTPTLLMLAQLCNAALQPESARAAS